MAATSGGAGGIWPAPVPGNDIDNAEMRTNTQEQTVFMATTS
jgi:hypothetical protein